MNSDSDQPHIPSNSSLSSLRATPAWTHVPRKGVDTVKITQTHQKERGNLLCAQSENHRHAICATTIDTLTDNVLLEIFDLIRSSRTEFQVRISPVWKWHTLVRVCRRWRQIIFASPLRLDLQILCTNGTSVRKDIDRWPTFPIVVDFFRWKNLTPDEEDNVFAALEHPSRVRHLGLPVTNSLLEKMATVLQGPFPVLSRLSLASQDLNVPVLPDGSLGGSAPCLREIWLHGIPFPALPTVLFSASNLIELLLLDIPQTGYISPEAFVACLAVLPKLQCLSIGFQSPAPRTDQIHLPLETRVVLPSLTSFSFEGSSAYLEVIMARIGAPLLDSINIMYPDKSEDLQVTELSTFIDHSSLKPSRRGHAEIFFEDGEVFFHFCRKTDPDEPTVTIGVSSFDGIRGQVWAMAQVLNQTSTMLSDVVRLEIKLDDPWQIEDGDMDDIEWLELFRPFTAVKTLRVYEELVESVTLALDDMAEEAGTQVLPALNSIYVEDQRARAMKELLADLRDKGRLLNSIVDEGLDSDDSE